MNVLRAPEDLALNNCFSVFLAGSIEGNTALKWQDIVIENLRDINGIILNPRREAWDASWKQDANNPIFNEQVNWELKALERADMIVVYFDKRTKSPITLLELGLFARSEKLLVCCPIGFWKKGNVDIVCTRFGIPTVKNLDDLIIEIKKRAS